MKGTGGLDELRDATRELAEVRDRHRALIVAAVAAGERPTDIARAAGVSREWVYRLKSARSTSARSTSGGWE